MASRSTTCAGSRPKGGSRAKSAARVAASGADRPPRRSARPIARSAPATAPAAASGYPGRPRRRPCARSAPVHPAAPRWRGRGTAAPRRDHMPPARSARRRLPRAGSRRGRACVRRRRCATPGRCASAPGTWRHRRQAQELLGPGEPQQSCRVADAPVLEGDHVAVAAALERAWVGGIELADAVGRNRLQQQNADPRQRFGVGRHHCAERRSDDLGGADALPPPAAPMPAKTEGSATAGRSASAISSACSTRTSSPSTLRPWPRISARRALASRPPTRTGRIPGRAPRPA